MFIKILSVCRILMMLRPSLSTLTQISWQYYHIPSIFCFPIVQNLLKCKKEIIDSMFLFLKWFDVIKNLFMRIKLIGEFSYFELELWTSFSYFEVSWTVDTFQIQEQPKVWCLQLIFTAHIHLSVISGREIASRVHWLCQKSILSSSSYWLNSPFHVKKYT